MLLLAMATPGRGALAPALAPPGGNGTNAPQGDYDLSLLLKAYPFNTVPLATSLADKTPRVRQDKGTSPAWKKHWDEARRLAVVGKLAQAAELYHKLLAEKEISEAHWELATILVALGQDKEAKGIVESLNEATPDRPQYVQCLAVISLHLGQFREAAEAFSHLHALQPGNAEALAGEVYSLVAAGDSEAALPRLETIWRLTPTDRGLRELLATLAYAAHDHARAWPHLVELANGPKPKAKILLMAARLSDTRAPPQEGLRFWQLYVAAQPDDLEGRQWLANFFEKTGQEQEALPHLLAIHLRRPGDLPVLKRIGQGYAAVGDFAKALDFLEKYAALRPEDKEVAATLTRSHEALGHKTETLRALEHYFALEPHPDEVDLKRAAHLYEEAGAQAEVITVYRRLVALHPDEPVLLRALATRLLAAGRQEEALSSWQRLARLLPEESDIYRTMATILESLGRQPELDHTLATLHRLQPTDHALSLKLAARYLAKDDLQRATEVLTGMERQGGAKPAAFYSWRGTLRMKQHDFAAALLDLEGFLAQEPNEQSARRQAMIAAGRLGDVVRVRIHEQALSSGGKAMPLDLQLLVAQAYADCRAETEASALFQKVIDEWLAADSGSIEVMQQAFAGLAGTFSREDRPYEEEETWRTGLVATDDRLFFLPPLFALALRQGQVGEAQGWLAGLRPLLADNAPRLALMEAMLLAAQGETRQARRRLWSVNDAFAELDKTGEGPDQRETIADRLALAAQWLKAGNNALAARQCARVLALDGDNLEAKVILAKGRAVLAQGAGRIDPGQLRPDQLLTLAGLYRQYDLPQGMAKAARQALTLVPQSLAAGLTLADSLVALGDFDAAQVQLEKLAADHPREFSLKVRIATLQFMGGKLAAVEELLHSPEAQSRPELILLRARLLWRQNRWDEAIKLYQDFLTPRVAAILRRSAKECRINLPDVKPKRSVWEILTRDPGSDPDSLFAAQVMAPATVLSFLDQGQSRFSLAAARLVAAHRWQAEFALELAPRQSVVRREYTIAQKQYESLFARYPRQRLLLYDLAGMYSRLGELGQEEAAYDKLSAAGIDFPELAEARTRNRLKQQPQTALTYGYQSDGGRHGYLDIEKDWQGISFWDSLSTQHEMEMKVDRINYHAKSWEDTMRATRATASYSTTMMHGLTVRGTGGLESQDQGHDTLLVNTTVVGKIGDGLTGTMAYDREVVADTTASLRRHIVRQDLSGGMSLAPLPRLSLGGDYLLRDYSDNNWTTGYDLWSTYLILAEPTFLQMKYSYDFKESREGNAQSGSGEDGFAAEDHPYWAPKNYWVNQIGLYFKHSLADDSLEREASRYYTLEYAVGHDVDGYAVQTAKAGLYAEFTPHCLLTAAGELVNSQAVRKQEYRLDLIYRW